MTEVQALQAEKIGTGRYLALALVCTVISLACLAIPMFVIRPFRPQGAGELNLALTVRHIGPWLSGICAVVVLLLLVRLWQVMSREAWQASV